MSPIAVGSDRPTHEPAARNVALWLLCCCAVLFALVVVGGVTRLTHSGLSITEWRPITGALPPLSEADWSEAFAKYRQTPEYREVHRGISERQFRRIFWWEFSHRLLARALGLVFLLPFLWFLARGLLERALAWRLAGILLLGAAQGGLGWLLVASGLVDEPRVSHFRLAAHLGLAFAIYSLLLWLAVDRLRAVPVGAAGSRSRSAPLAGAVVALALLQSLAGGLVAGSRAGLLYPTFPLMDGHLVPPGLLRSGLRAGALLHDPAAIQFLHRALAWTLLVAVLALWARGLRPQAPRGKRIAIHALAALTVVQFSLGVATLLSHLSMPLAVLHQGGGLLLLTAALWVLHVSCHPEPGSRGPAPAPA